jgi:hypothetical protein
MVGLDFEELLTESSSSNSVAKPQTDDVMDIKKTNSQLSALVIGQSLAKSAKKASSGRSSTGKSLSSSSPMQLRGMSPTDITSKVKASYKRRNRR